MDAADRQRTISCWDDHSQLPFVMSQRAVLRHWHSLQVSLNTPPHYIPSEKSQHPPEFQHCRCCPPNSKFLSSKLKERLTVTSINQTWIKVSSHKKALAVVLWDNIFYLINFIAYLYKCIFSSVFYLQIILSCRIIWNIFPVTWLWLGKVGT